MMFGLHHHHAAAAHHVAHQDAAALHRGAVTTLKEEPLGSSVASAQHLHHAARSWMQPAGIGMEHSGG